jgi:hypothetical protein
MSWPESTDGTAQQDRCFAERLDGKAKRGKRFAVFHEGGGLRRGWLEGQRSEQALHLWLGRGTLAGDALEQHSLVGGVLIDHVHAVWSLGDDVGAAHLPYHPQHGQERPRCQRWGWGHRLW